MPSTTSTVLSAVAVLAACACAEPPRPAAPPQPAPNAVPAAATIDPALEPLKPLVGAWEGGDPNAKSSGRFTLAPELLGKVLVRRSTNDSPKGHHEDLMIVSPTPAGLRASYWDNEGHVIHYAVTVSGSHVEMLSDEVPNAPRFKLTYDVRGNDELAIDFAIAMPGSSEMKHYTGGSVHRVAR